MIIRITRNGIRYTYEISAHAVTLYGPSIDATLLIGAP